MDWNGQDLNGMNKKQEDRTCCRRIDDGIKHQHPSSIIIIIIIIVIVIISLSLLALSFFLDLPLWNKLLLPSLVKYHTYTRTIRYDTIQYVYRKLNRHRGNTIQY